MTDQAVEDIVRPLARHLRADSGSLVIVNHGQAFPEEIAQEVEGTLRREGLNVLPTYFKELAPDPVARLLELRKLREIDVFSIRIPTEGLGVDGRALVSALNLHRSIYAREKLHAIFWIPRQILPIFAEHAANFLDFRTRLVDIETEESDLPVERSALANLPLESTPKLLESFLSLARKSPRADSSERALVYAKIPEILESPEEVIYLLDRLRRSTRNGKELFYLERAAQVVGEYWPEFSDEVRNFRDRMFDHIPPPPEALFGSIKTVDGGEVALWREIPKGQFLMGSPSGDEMGQEDERPQHLVVFNSPFRLMSVPVTSAQYQAFDPETREGEEDHPAVGLQLADILSFCRWLGGWPQTLGARLPTEEEWEYACRAGTTTRYWSGDTEMDLSRVGWYEINSGGRIHKVASKPPNPWGLYDVHGNVWEWTASRYAQDTYEDRKGGLLIDSSELTLSMDSEALGRVTRGGSFVSRASATRAACRGGSFKHMPWGFWSQGFRVLLPSTSGG